MSLKLFIKSNIGPLYSMLKRLNDKLINKRKFSFTGCFKNRSKGQKKLCIMLAGYKPFLYENVLDRLTRYIEDDIDVCLVTSGLYSEEIDKICSENGWSYLSTKQNNVCLVQNIAIKLHPNAEYIFKLDEDIFITKNYFTNLIRAFDHAATGNYNIGVIAPLLPINGFCYSLVLDKLNVTEEYEERFGKIIIGASESRENVASIEISSDIAKFFWGEKNIVPTIDYMNSVFSKDPPEEVACPVRFSIGAILFKRELWEKMGYYDVDLKTSQMGRDEKQLCAFCMISSRPLMVSTNVVAGHFSFGKQTAAMKEYYDSNPERFFDYKEY